MKQQILDYTIEIIDIRNFKEYLEENVKENKIYGFALKAFLKAVDIPPSYFLEQPIETQEELLVNKDERINSLKKYTDKCLVILWKDDEILNCCRMNMIDAETLLEKFSTIEDVDKIIWDKTFYKDGYIQGYIPTSDNIAKDKFNRCLVIDFPILLNKPLRINDGFFRLPQESEISDNNTYYYNTSEEIDMTEYQHVALAIQDKLNDAECTGWPSMDVIEDVNILREPTEVCCVMVDEKVIPKTILTGLVEYIETNSELGNFTMTINNLTETILKFEGNLRNIKQVTNLRGCYDYLRTNYKDEKEVSKV